MVLSQILSWMKVCSQKLPNVYGNIPNNDELVRLLNLAMERFARDFHIVDPMVTLTLSTPGERFYDLQDLTVVGRRVLEPHSVYINGVNIKPRPFYSGDAGVASLEQLQILHRNWRTEEPGPPTIAAWVNNRRLILSPPPDQATIDAAQNFIQGIIIPGAIGADGYQPAGFTETTTVVAGGTVTTTDAQSAGTVEAIQEPTGWTGDNTDVSAEDTDYAEITLAWPLTGDTVIGSIRNFDFSAIPAGAVINWVKVSTFTVASPDAYGVQGGFIVKMVSDATDTSGGTVFGTYEAMPTMGSTYDNRESPEFSGMTRAQLLNSTFGLIVEQDLYVNGSPTPAIGGTYHSRLNKVELTVNYTFESSGSTQTSIDLTAKPDLPDDTHDALAIAALLIGAYPMADTAEVLRIMGNIAPDAAARLTAIGKANRNAQTRPPVIIGRGETGLSYHEWCD